MMFKKTVLLTGILALLVFSGGIQAVVHDYAGVTGPGGSGVVEAVQNQNADPSPGSAASNLNNYLYQDEQVNINPDSGVVKVLRTDQKINVNKFVTDMVQFKNANPRELRHAFRTICRKEGGDSDVVQDKEKKEFYLHVVCPEFQLPYLHEAARALDVDWLKVGESGHLHYYYKAKFRPINDIIWISQYYRSGEGYFVTDPDNNAFYFNDSPACKGLQDWAVSQIDIPPNQVLLDIVVYDVNTQADAKIGLDWIDWKNGPGRHLFEGILSSAHHKGTAKFKSGSTIDSIIRSDIDNDYRYMNVQAIATTEFVDFLQIKGKARETMRTTLMAQSGQFVESSSMEQVVAIQAVHDSTPSNDEVINREPNVNSKGVQDLPQAHERWTNYVQSGNVGSAIIMRPSIGLESMELEMHAGVSTVSGQTANGLPVIDESVLMTSVRLKNGEPLVIAGLKHQNAINETRKVPLLGDIPVLGWLFGGETSTNREREMVIVVTPRFLLGADSDLQMPAEYQTLVAQAKGTETIEAPRNSYGFDQWLLDGSK